MMAINKLCLQCQKIAFQTIFTKRIETLTITDQSRNIGTLRERWAREDCAFCTLVKHAFNAHYGCEYVKDQLSKQSGCELAISQSPVNIRHYIWDYSTSDAEMAPFYISIHSSKPNLERMTWKSDDEFNTGWSAPRLHLILEENQAGEASTGLYGRTVVHDAIDWAYLAQWLNTCKNRHAITPRGHDKGAHCESLRGSARPLGATQRLVIDVNRRCVVPMPKDGEYIALSYMWGKDQALKLKKANYELLQATNILDPVSGNVQPSQTIIDAIEVTRRLGYSYIWVDALCITQDNPQTILANVGMMDLIYAQAALTIVAAAGNNADSGLPGVSKGIPRTQQQMRQNIDGLVVANMLDTHNGAINYSTWNTRGWTYQERLLSPRLLIFTDAQVYYECNQECHFQEDLHLGDGSAHPEGSDRRYQLDLENENLFNAYALAVAEYTKRSLTDRGDKLRAFAAFLSTLIEPFRGPFFFGIPVTVFDVGLLWTPIGSCRRGNKMFPSWSWAGWDGPVRYAMRDSMGNLCECTASQVEIETHGNARLCTPFDPVLPGSNVFSDGEDKAWSRHIDEDTREIYYKLTNQEGKAVYPYQYPRPLTPLGKEDSHRLVSSDSALLKITGLTAPFLLTSHHSQLYTSFSTCREGRHEQCPLAVFDEQGRIAGTVFVAGSLVSQLQDKTHRFLALTRSTLNRVDLDPSWDEETKSFRFWTHPESGVPGEPDSDDEDLFNADGVKISGRAAFDVAEFNGRVFWPTFDVILLAEQDDGTAERLGIGKIHVDAFLCVAKKSCVLLG
ncbi:HET-domain-containing protein [Stipitochalara longipes BDJ]|nr:HET-domain-containing protein [Stipitochalara longipes BDJ]